MNADAAIRIVLHSPEVVHLDPHEGDLYGDQMNNPRSTSSVTPTNGTILYPRTRINAQAHPRSGESNHPGPHGKDISGHRRLIHTLSPKTIALTPTVRILLVEGIPCGPVPILGMWCSR